MKCRIITLLAICVCISCSNAINSNNYEIFGYKDFGPQALASELIGTSWWQWEDHADSYPRDYPIFVIVYRNVDLQDIKRLFPVIREKKLDYRYVEYQKAMGFLDHAIKELEPDKASLPRMMLETLKRTRHRIMLGFGEFKRDVE